MGLFVGETADLVDHRLSLGGPVIDEDFVLDRSRDTLRTLLADQEEGVLLHDGAIHESARLGIIETHRVTLEHLGIDPLVHQHHYQLAVCHAEVTHSLSDGPVLVGESFDLLFQNTLLLALAGTVPVDDDVHRIPAVILLELPETVHGQKPHGLVGVHDIGEHLGLAVVLAHVAVDGGYDA